jgi:hypothetical protein
MMGSVGSRMLWLRALDNRPDTAIRSRHRVRVSIFMIVKGKKGVVLSIKYAGISGRKWVRFYAEG